MTSKNRFKKQPLTVVALLGVATMLLAGCTQDGTTTSVDKLENRAVEQMPEWDVRELVAGSWYNEGGEPQSTGDSSNPDDIPGLTDDVFLNNWVTLLDDPTGCRITGRVLHAPASMAGRGDDFNTRDYLYSMVPFESKYGTLSITDVNGTDFVEMDHFVAPSEEGEAGWHHRAAARTFDAVLDIEGMTLEGDDTGAHGSSLVQGVPVAYIDFSCRDETNLTQERWEAGLKSFTLLFDIPADSTENAGDPVPAPEEGAETPTEEAPADGEPEVSDAPVEGEEPTDAPAETEGDTTEGN